MFSIPNIPRRNSAKLTWAINYIKSRGSGSNQYITAKFGPHKDWFESPSMTFKDWFDVCPEHLPLLEACLFHDSVELLDLILDKAYLCGELRVHAANSTFSEYTKIRPKFIKAAHANLAYQLLLTHLWHPWTVDAGYKKVACNDGIV